MYVQSLYESIEADEELKMFFLKLSKYFEFTKSRILEQKKIELEQIKPTTNKVYDIIHFFELAEVNVQNMEECLDIENYMNGEKNAMSIFSNITFNGVSFNEKDINDLIKKFSGEIINLNYEYLAQKQYNEWLKNNKNIEKVYKKYTRKSSSKQNYAYYIDGEIVSPAEMECIISEGTKLKQKADLLNEFGQTTRMVLELYDQINDLYEQCAKFNMSKAEIDRKYESILYSKAEESFNKMINESLVEIDIERITEILLNKIIKVRAARILDLREIETELDIDVVNWFISFKKQELTELMNLMFDNYETLLDDFKFKMKVKRIFGWGIL